MSSWFKDCASTCWRDSFSASCTLGSLCSMPRFCAVVAMTSKVVNCCAICCFAVGGSSARRVFGTTAFTIFSNSALVMTVLQFAEVAGLSLAVLPAAVAPPVVSLVPAAADAAPVAEPAVAEQRCLMVITAVCAGKFAPGSLSAAFGSSDLGDLGEASAAPAVAGALGPPFAGFWGEGEVCAIATKQINRKMGMTRYIGRKPPAGFRNNRQT